MSIEIERAGVTGRPQMIGGGMRHPPEKHFGRSALPSDFLRETKNEEDDHDSVVRG